MSVEQHTPFAAAAAYIAEQPQPRVTVPVRSVLVGPTAVEVRLGGRVVAVDEPHSPRTPPRRRPPTACSPRSCLPALDAIWRAEARSRRLDIPVARTFLDPNLDLPTRRTAG